LLCAQQIFCRRQKARHALRQKLKNNNYKIMRFYWTTLLSLIVWILGAQPRFSLSAELSAYGGLAFIQQQPNLLTEPKEYADIMGSYAGGLQLSYELSRGYFLRTGLGYRYSRLRHRIEGLRFGSDILLGTESKIFNDLQLHALSLPLEVYRRQHRLGKRYAFHWGAGGQVHRQLRADWDTRVIYQNFPAEPIKEANNRLQPWSFSAGVFTGLEYFLGNALILGIEPHLRITFMDYQLFLYDSRINRVVEGGVRLRLQL